MKNLILCAVVVFLVTSTMNGQATTPASDSGSWKNGKYLTGNWGGLRDTLAEHGIAPFIYWTGIASGNPVGGAKKGFTPVDDTYFGVNFNLEKFSGWRGASVTVSGVNRDGRGLSNDYIKSQYNVQQSVGGQTLFFYQLYLEQKLLKNKLKFKVGRFSASDDLNASPIYGNYVNNGIDGDMRNVLFDTQSSAYPFATWAGLMRFDPTPQYNVSFAVYQTWDRIFDNTLHGLDWDIHSGDGVIYMWQAGWTPEFAKKAVGGTTDSNGAVLPADAVKGLPGHYWVGATYSPWKGFTQFGRPDKVADSYGFYVHGDQKIYEEAPGSDQGLTVWAASGVYPQGNISIVPFQVNVGLIYQGLIPGRDLDRTIFGVIHGNFSREYAATIAAQGNGNPRSETVIEGAYRIQFTKFIFFQPDMQWVIQPAGTGRIPNALAVGAEMGLVF